VADQLQQAARALLAANRRQGTALDGRPVAFCCPSPTTYPYQWFWDSCFHAVALSHLEPKWAVEELEALIGAQRPDGFIPHVSFHGGRRPSYWAYVQGRGVRPRSSAMIQPPLLGLAVERVARLTGDDDLRSRLLTAVDRYHEWLFRERDHDGDSLISIISPYESGLDHKPAYDRVLGSHSRAARSLTPRLRLLDIGNKRRGFSLRRNAQGKRFHCEDVLVNVALALSLDSVAASWEAMNESTPASRAREKAASVASALVTKCYDDESGLFWDLYGADERPLDVATISGLTPLALPGLPAAIVKRLVDKLSADDFWTEFPVPSVSTKEPSFRPDAPFSGRSPLIWRGGTWINTNWLLQMGLLRYGYVEQAGHLLERSLRLVERSGFREFYNPLTGEGYGAENFGWSTLVVDMCARQNSA
jgi:glycogen debranching enzyme